MPAVPWINFSETSVLGQGTKRGTVQGRRHDSICDVLIGMWKALGGTCAADHKKELNRLGSNLIGSECALPSGNRVDVILFGAGTKGADIAIDVSVVCTETYYPKTFNEAIKKREEDKNAMYKDECEKQQMEFFPFVLGSKGGFGKSAKELWDVLVKKANQIGGRDWRHSWTAMSYSSVWKQKLSIAIANWTAMGALRRTPMISRRVALGGGESFVDIGVAEARRGGGVGG